MLYATALLVSSCADVAENPPKPSFSVDKTSGNTGQDFTFTISQVSAGSVTLFPYGTAYGSYGSVSIDPKSFDGGTATVKFQYTHVGTFSAVVVTNNHTADGKSIKNSTSDPVSIVITSNNKALSSFTLQYQKDAKTIVPSLTTLPLSIPAGGGPITVTIPYIPTDHAKKLAAVFTADPYTKVLVGSTEQVSGKTVNDFTSPVTYTVKADDGTSVNYVVTVVETPVETLSDIKTVSGKLTSKSAKDKVVPAYVDNTSKIIVVYDSIGTPARFDSVRIAYALNGKFATMSYGGNPIKQDSLLNISANDKILKVTAQDATFADYKVYGVMAPKFVLSFDNLIPVVTGVVKDFNITMNVVTQPSKIYNTYFTTPSLPAGVTVDNVKADDITITNGSLVDYTKPVKIAVTYNDTNLSIKYTVIYTVSLKQF